VRSITSDDYLLVDDILRWSGVIATLLLFGFECVSFIIPSTKLYLFLVGAIPRMDCNEYDFINVMYPHADAAIILHFSRALYRS